VNIDRYFRGRLLGFVPASLLVFFSREFLRWQFPATAASETVARLATLVRESLGS
jgi:hypothetical protein